MGLSDVLTIAPAGLYCPAGDFYIDPLRPVSRALITHGHADHARAGHGAVLATRETLDIMALRYGEQFAASRQAMAPGQRITLGGVEVSFHPAGHVLGSAQILLESRGYRVVVSGDYKRAHDPTCAPFEPVRCHAFISEATFGLPVFRHPDAAGEVERLMRSIALFPDRAHLVGVYSLGKAQRVMALLRAAGWERPVYIHGALEKITDYYALAGARLGAIRKVSASDRATLAGDVTRRRPFRMSGRENFPIPSPPSRLAGCAFAPSRASAARNCHW